MPIDVELDDETYALVLTGPNTGGKTVTPEDGGLAGVDGAVRAAPPGPVRLGAVGLPEMFADIGDEQSIEQSLSTFSAHITNIIRVLEEGR